jgi:hypothetical protein
MRERKSGEEDEVQDTISMVSVILDDYQCQYQNLSEPLVIAGCFLYKPPRSLAKLKKQYHYNFAEYGPKICRSIDGRVYKWEPGAGDNVEFVRMAAFARPLVEIENADDLKRLITDPLFKLIKDHLEEGVNVIG